MKVFYQLAIPSIPIPFLALIATLGQTASAQSAQSIKAFNPFPQESIYKCNVDSVLLDAGPGYVSYYWNTGDTTQTIQATRTGNYIVGVVSNVDSILYDTVFVSVINYTLDAFSKQNDPFLQNFDSVSDKTLIISIQYPFNRETILYYNKGSIWVASEDCVIDSLTFSVVSYSPMSTTEPSYGVLKVYDVAGDPINGSNLLKGTYYWAINSPGLVTLPVSLFLRKGKKYRFDFGKGPQKTQSFLGNMANLRVGKIEGFSSVENTYNTLSNGVWIKLHGNLSSYKGTGKTFYSCYGNPVLINMNRSYSNYAWSTDSIVPSIKATPTKDSTIYISISNDSHTCNDTVQIKVFNTPFQPFATDSIFACSEKKIFLKAGTDGFSNYIWNNTLQTTPEIWADTEEWHKVSALGEENCRASDSVYVMLSGAITKQYKFTGNGLYSDSKNWDNKTKPPAKIGPHEAIYIDPSGNSTCTMDVPQTITSCSSFFVMKKGKLLLSSSLKILK